MIRLLLAFCLWASTASASYLTTIQADAPNHWWHLNETSGTNAFDNGSNAQACAYNGTFTLAQTGIPGNVTSFPQYGVTIAGATNSSYISCASLTNANPSSTSSQGWTFEIWIYPTSVTGTHIIGGQQTVGPTRAMWVVYMAGAALDSLMFSNNSTCGGGGYGDTGSQGTVSINTWHQVVVSTLGAGSSHLTHHRLYLDGALLIEQTSFSASPNDTLCQTVPSITGFGLRQSDVGTSSVSFGGNLDEPSFYTSELTAKQIANHYGQGINKGVAQMPWIVRRASERNLWPVVFAPSIPQEMRLWSKGGKIMAGGQYSDMTVGFPNFEVVPNGNVH